MENDKRFYIRILSPVHVGCDEVYEPTGFVVNEDAAILTAFDPLDFFSRLGGQDKGRYAGICRKGTVESIMELYKFMKGKTFPGHEVGMCEGFVAHYKKTLSLSSHDRRKIQQELNNFTISRTSFDPTTQKPYVPGSAIKGALRTAYLNHMAKRKTVNYDRRDRKAADNLEKGLLEYQKLENDPFRLLKVSDFYPVGPCRTRIVYAVNEKKTASQFLARGPYQILEIVEPGAIFTGTIRVLEPLTRSVIAEPLTEKTILDSAAAFYRSEMGRENEELVEADIPAFSSPGKEVGVQLRIGRHSGAESVTIEGHRQIRIMKKRGERPGYSNKGATTFWLAASVASGYPKTTLKPFGWVSLGVLSAEMAAALVSQAEPEKTSGVSVSVSHPLADEVPAMTIVPKTKPRREKWDAATVSWNPGSRIVTAVWNGKKAQGEGSLIPESLKGRVVEKRKSIQTLVTVEPVGNGFRIVEIQG
ncbi:MAG: type III-A CRISPR-associated RAMP protein Csm5 [Syntrophales bacterium]|jgi:CRISPR-associated protein Csm5|nr:type III-A CRISPR-associated RAMP protein Csm5 [Syntrophales bacterium]